MEAIDDMLSLPGLMLLSVPSDLIARWRHLARQIKVAKKRAFDTQLVATMLANGVTKIYTFNTPDFQHFAFAGIQVLSP